MRKLLIACLGAPLLYAGPSVCYRTGLKEKLLLLLGDQALGLQMNARLQIGELLLEIMFGGFSIFPRIDEPSIISIPGMFNFSYGSLVPIASPFSKQ